MIRHRERLASLNPPQVVRPTSGATLISEILLVADYVLSERQTR
jgi:hypothetical protein